MNAFKVIFLWAASCIRKAANKNMFPKTPKQFRSVLSSPMRACESRTSIVVKALEQVWTDGGLVRRLGLRAKLSPQIRAVTGRSRPLVLSARDTMPSAWTSHLERCMR
jgi:hypothetical protein